MSDESMTADMAVATGLGMMGAPDQRQPAALPKVDPSSSVNHVGEFVTSKAGSARTPSAQTSEGAFENFGTRHCQTRPSDMKV